MKKFLVCFLMLVLMSPYCYAAAGVESMDTGHLGNNQWHVRSDGDIEPNVDSTYDIGQSGNEVAQLYVDSIILNGNTIPVTAGGHIDFTVGDFIASGPVVLSASTKPGYAMYQNRLVLAYPDGGAVTPVVVSFRVPQDYLSGMSFRVVASESDSTTPNQIDFLVYTTGDGEPYPTSITNQTPVALAGTVATPDVVTLTVATDFDLLAAGDFVTLAIWCDNAADGTGILYIDSVQAVYTKTS